MSTTKPRRIPRMSEAMTPFPWSVRASDSLVHARSVMTKHQIRHLPVTKDDRLIGVVTDRDIHLVESVFTDMTDRYALTVGDVAVAHTFIVDVHEPLDSVLLQLAERHIGSALVVRGEKLVGIFTVTDACRHFGEFLRAVFPEGTDDKAA